MNYDELICKVFFENDWKFRRNVRIKYAKSKDRYVNIQNYLKEKFPDSQSDKESLYRIKHNITERPVCKECGKPVVFVGKGGVLFRDFCTVKCAQGNKEVQQKKAETDKKSHNGRRGWNCYDPNDPIRKQKIKDVILKKYGSFKNAANIEKRKQTCLKRYGVEHCMSNLEIQQKRNKTLTLNNAKCNSSKHEKIAYEMLKEIYPDIVFHYTSDDYPWNCDFYVPSEDLYIEYHGFYYHNGKPYEGTEDDLDQVNKLKEKSERLHKEWDVPLDKKIYPDTILYVWTDLDVRKRNHCKENNINYLELYNLKEVEEYINKKKSNL